MCLFLLIYQYLYEIGHLAVEDLKFPSFGQYIMRLKLSLIYVFKGKKLHYICLTNELYVSYLFRHSLRKNLLGYYYFIFTGMCYITARGQAGGTWPYQ